MIRFSFGAFARRLLLASWGLWTASSASAGLYYIGAASVPGNTTDSSGLTGLLEDGVTPGNQVGGFGSAIAYMGNGQYIATPDRGPADGTTTYADRAYTFNIHVTPGNPAIPGSGTVTASLDKTILLKNEKGQQFTGSAAATVAGQPSSDPNSLRLDPEGIRMSADGHSFYVSDEYGPFVYEFNLAGQRIAVLDPGSKFAVANPNSNPNLEFPPVNTAGRQPNRGMEGLAITPDGKTLFGMLQSPLIQDNGLNAANQRRGTNDRIVEIDAQTGLPVAEYLYQLDNRSYGVSEILAVNDHQFLVLERDGNVGAAAAFKQVKLIDIDGATNIQGVASLPQTGTPAGITPVSKSLFLDLLDPQWGLAGSAFPEKIEGLAFGPKLSNGDNLLLVTVDNDFFSDRGSLIYAFGFSADILPTLQQQVFVPEPGSLALLLTGSVGAVLVRLRSRRKLS